MRSIFYPTCFIALASATRFSHCADEFSAYSIKAGAAKSTPSDKDWIYVTEYTTVYPTPSPRASNLWAQYGSGLPGPSPLSLSLPPVSIVNPKISKTNFPSDTPTCHGPSSVVPPSIIPSFTLDPTSIPDSPVHSPTPRASSSFVKSVAPSAKPSPPTPLSLPPYVPSVSFSPYFRSSSLAPLVAPSNLVPSWYSSSPIPTPIPTPVPSPPMNSSQWDSPAIVATLVDSTGGIKPWPSSTMDSWTNVISVPAGGLTKRHEGDEHGYSTTTRTTTIKKTLTTSKLLSSMVSRTSSRTPDSIRSISMVTTYKPSLISTPKPSPTPTLTSAAGAVITSVIPADDHCPYPYPGAHCGEPLTTLVTLTKSDKPITTKKEEPKSAGWCPYPGRIY